MPGGFIIFHYTTAFIYYLTPTPMKTALGILAGVLIALVIAFVFGIFPRAKQHNYVLLSDLALRSAIANSADSDLIQSLKEASNADNYELMQTKTMLSKGTCCCPCDSMRVSSVIKGRTAARSSCPCPSLYKIAYVVSAASDATIAIDGNNLEAEQLDGDMKNWKKFELPENTALKTGKHTLTVKGDLAGTGMKTYTVDVFLTNDSPRETKDK
jgi:hypothetical protein